MKIKYSKKSATCWLLAFIMAFSMLALSGCASEKPADNTAPETSNTQDQPDSSQDTQEPQTDIAAPEEELAPETPKYVVGTRTETTWISDWAGLQFTAGTNMVMSTDEEIENMMRIGADAMYEDEATGQQAIDFSKLTTVYEMMAIDSTTNGNVIVAVEKPSASGITEAEYIAAMKDQLDQTLMGATYGDTATQTLAGIDFTKMELTAETNGVAYQQTYLIHKIDDRVLSIVFTYMSTDSYNDMLNMFSAIGA